MPKNKLVLLINDIYLFDHRSFASKKYHSKLKVFLSFLHYQKVSKPIKFAYVGSPDQWLPDLTLKENILLDSIPSSLINTKEFVFAKYFKKSKNNFLTELLKEIDTLDQMPETADNTTKKIANLIKGFLLVENTNYFMLENPDKYLNEKQLDILKNALQFESRARGINILIVTEKPKLWQNISNKFVSQNDQNEFIISPIDRSQQDLQEEEQELDQYPSEEMKAS